MKLHKITFSPTGGTGRAADLLAKGIPGEWRSMNLLPPHQDAKAALFAKEDLCLIAVPSYGGRVPEAAVQRLLRLKGNGARCILMVVYGNREYDDTLLELKHTVKEAGFIPVAAVAAVAEHSIMRQFAAGRPDTEDEKELCRFGNEIWEYLKSEEMVQEVSVPGNETYREYHGVPMKPKTARGCIHCGLCVKECPVEAITPEKQETIPEKCISCMRCIAVCPKKARKVSGLMLFAAGQKMKKVCGGHKPNTLFLGGTHGTTA